MAELRLEAAGPVGGETAPLVGITDLQIVEGAAGPVLLSATRGDGWVSAHDVSGAAPVLLDRWEIDAGYLQRESTDIVQLPGGDLWLAGLKSPDMVILGWQGNGFG